MDVPQTFPFPSFAHWSQGGHLTHGSTTVDGRHFCATGEHVRLTAAWMLPFGVLPGDVCLGLQQSEYYGQQVLCSAVLGLYHIPRYFSSTGVASTLHMMRTPPTFANHRYTPGTNATLYTAVAPSFLLWTLACRELDTSPET